MTTRNNSIATQQYITSGDVLRWFSVDWEFFGDVRAATNLHDEIFDILLDLKEAKECNSGHTGVNVAFENSQRTDRKLSQRYDGD